MQKKLSNKLIYTFEFKILKAFRNRDWAIIGGGEFTLNEINKMERGK